MRNSKPVSQCRPCSTAYHKRWRKANRKRLNASVRGNYKKTRSKQQAYGLKWRSKHPTAVLLASARIRARKTGVPFAIKRSDIVIPDLCPFLGIPLIPQHHGTPGGGKESPSLDRIIPSLGYVPGNIQVISHLANNMKSFATPVEMVTFAKAVLRTYNDLGNQKVAA